MTIRPHLDELFNQAHTESMPRLFNITADLSNKTATNKECSVVDQASLCEKGLTKTFGVSKCLFIYLFLALKMILEMLKI